MARNNNNIDRCSEQCPCRDGACEKKSSGKGKFWLGAALGTVVGAVAGHFISTKVRNAAEKAEEEERDLEEAAEIAGKEIEEAEKKAAE
ncbi:MAG: hypothetical protein Q4B87_02340, partial [Candidatus Saccharibacteria bacterium]|nr:hypothetical protein [Candidatus Saccharibacteria bacterium]